MRTLVYEILVLALLGFAALTAVASEHCQSVTIVGHLAAGERFERALNRDFVFKLMPTRLGPEGNVDGWEIGLLGPGGPNRDYIYPVNPPLRFNGLQILGPSYGEDSKMSLGRPHVMRFLLSENDDQRLWPLVTNALWPYSAPDPEKASDHYLNALKEVSTGELTVTVLSYTSDPNSGSVRQIRFRAGFKVPRNFEFARSLNPKAATCSAIGRE